MSSERQTYTMTQADYDQILERISAARKVSGMFLSGGSEATFERMLADAKERLLELAMTWPYGTTLSDDIQLLISAYDALSAKSEAPVGQDAKTVERLKAALEDVVNPTVYLRRKAEAEGKKLGGYAYELSRNPDFIQSIAREALAALATLNGSRDDD